MWIYAAIITLILQNLSGVNSIDLYTIISKSDKGDLKLKVTKEYEFWTEQNKTIYQINIDSTQDMLAGKQELRFALNWVFQNSQIQRVVFYGDRETKSFNQYRLDNNFETNGSLTYKNDYILSLPKSDKKLREVLTEENNYQFNIISSSIEQYKANITFYLNRDESFGSNKLWINWGLFGDNYDDDIEKALGPRNMPYSYYNELRFGDFFDRQFVFLLLSISAVTSVFNVFAAPFQMAVLLIYEVYITSVSIYSAAQLLSDPGMDLREKYINVFTFMYEVVGKWWGLSQLAIFSILTSVVTAIIGTFLSFYQKNYIALGFFVAAFVLIGPINNAIVLLCAWPLMLWT